MRKYLAYCLKSSGIGPVGKIFTPGQERKPFLMWEIGFMSVLLLGEPGQADLQPWLLVSVAILITLSVVGVLATALHHFWGLRLTRRKKGLFEERELEIDQLKQQLQSSQAELKDIQDKRDQLKSQIDRSASKRAQVNSREREVNRQMARLTSDRAELDSSIADWQQRISDAEESAHEAQRALSSIQDDLGASRRQAKLDSVSTIQGLRSTLKTSIESMCRTAQEFAPGARPLPRKIMSLVRIKSDTASLNDNISQTDLLAALESLNQGYIMLLRRERDKQSRQHRETQDPGSAPKAQSSAKAEALERQVEEQRKTLLTLEGQLDQLREIADFSPLAKRLAGLSKAIDSDHLRAREILLEEQSNSVDQASLLLALWATDQNDHNQLTRFEKVLIDPGSDLHEQRELLANIVCTALKHEGGARLFFALSAEKKKALYSQIGPDSVPALTAYFEELLSRGAYEEIEERLLPLAGEKVDATCFRLAATVLAHQEKCAELVDQLVTRAAKIEKAVSKQRKLNGLYRLAASAFEISRHYEQLAMIDSQHRDGLVRMFSPANATALSIAYLVNPNEFMWVKESGFLWDQLFVLQPQLASAIVETDDSVLRLGLQKIGEKELPEVLGLAPVSDDEVDHSLPEETLSAFAQLLLCNPRRYAEVLGRDLILSRLVDFLSPLQRAHLAQYFPSDAKRVATCLVGGKFYDQVVDDLHSQVSWDPESSAREHDFCMPAKAKIVFETGKHHRESFDQARSSLTTTVMALPALTWRHILSAALPEQAEHSSPLGEIGLRLIDCLVFLDLSHDGLKSLGFNDYDASHVRATHNLRHPLWSIKRSGQKSWPLYMDPIGHTVCRLAWSRSDLGSWRQKVVLGNASSFDRALRQAANQKNQ